MAQTLTQIEALEKVLTEEIELYKNYISLVESDKERMSQLNIDELEKNNKAKGTVLLKIQTVDQARQNLVKQIADVHKISVEKITIEDICRVISSGEAHRLKTLRAKLVGAIEYLKKVQDETTALATASLGWINGSMETLKRLLTPSGTYGPQGKVGRPNVFSGRMVEKEV